MSYLLVFVRSGFINAHDGTFRNAFAYGAWWASRANTTVNYSFAVDLNSSTIDNSVSGNRYGGRSLRCLSTVLGM